MIVAGSASPLLLASAAGGYNLTRSLRFRRSSGGNLSRTFTTPTDGKRATFSVWLKRGLLSTSGIDLLGDDGTGYLQFFFDSGNKFNLGVYTGTSTVQEFATDAVFRDPSAWYHFVIAIDTTQATASNRLKVYVNGVQQSGTTTGALTQNANIQVLGTSGAVKIGVRANYFDGYMTEINYVDGQALTSSSFGETSATTGVWQPKKYAGSYGTNGFYLPFTDNSALTTSSNVGLGKDFSGNGNYWVTDGISITAGSTYDSMTDVPTLTSATAANYCVMNPLAKDSDVTMSNGNLQFDCTSGGLGGAIGTFAVSSGKWYWEVVSTAGAGSSIGIAKLPLSAFDANQTGTYLYLQGGDKRLSPSTDSAYGASWTTNDVIGIALDMDAGTVVFYKNNASQGTAFSSLSGDFTAWVQDGSGGSASTIQANFGQRPFAYTPPTGFVALNTFNLPTPTIGATASTQANKYFDATLWTGNGASSRTITNAGGFQPDFLWIKQRSAVDVHVLVDSVRGTTKYLNTNNTTAESTYASEVTSFDSNGFTMGSDPNGWINFNSMTVVGWQWRASNATAVSNTAGSITSTVSANTSAGFSVVTYTGTGSNATVGHGLGVAPKFIIVKRRDNGDGDTNWPCWHTSLSANEIIILNLTNAKSTSATSFNSMTTLNSSVFSVGANAETNGTSMVAYCFSEIAGYSKFGSYTGNDNPNGTFVYTGFRPRYVMIKASNAAVGWVIYDSAINPTNEASNFLVANSSTAQLGSTPIDFVSNGFKLRNNDGSSNGANNYIYMAFAESPFKYANAR
jgi:hypothetical protein